MNKVTIIGAGLAGCEAAWKLGKAGIETRLVEMRPGKSTPAHKSGLMAELVCSNSLKADSVTNASGLLKAEMEALDSLVMKAARHTAVPAGGALAVDRERFAEYITAEIEALGSIELAREEATKIPEEGVVIIAAGPLASDALTAEIARITGEDQLAFYDAIAPIVTAESIDMGVAFRASRYGKGGDDYVNCPMDKAGYGSFVEALLNARLTPLRDFEDPKFFEGCLPIEVMASRGPETLAHGPMKPVGLRDPRCGKRPYAVVQLRLDDKEGRLYNMVGFQTRMARPEQERIFRTIPGLEKAEFARWGSVHRNTFIRSPLLLSPAMSLRKDPRVMFTGQITGVEGYLESAASGVVAGINAARTTRGLEPAAPGPETMIGALMHYVSDPGRVDFQPMNANFGIVAPLEARIRKSERKQAMAERALASIKRYAEDAWGV